MQFQRKHRIVFLTLVLFSFVMTAYAVSAVTPDVHYVPTPQYVVNEMLEMAGINNKDIVYDLGCGDGRFVITAAVKFGAQGVGIDIDPQRILDSQDNAKRAGVWERVKFYEKNLFQTDISQATIVALYLLPDLNLALRPKLFKELQPGTRIVSHDFDMKDWKPDDTGELGSSSYYLWIIPADVAGKWSLNSPPLGLDRDYPLQITQKFQYIEVSTASRREGETISDEKLRGDKISFLLIREKNRKKVAMHFKGRVKGNAMSGNVQVEGGLFEGVHEWTATR